MPFDDDRVGAAIAVVAVWCLLMDVVAGCYHLLLLLLVLVLLVSRTRRKHYRRYGRHGRYSR